MMKFYRFTMPRDVRNGHSYLSVDQWLEDEITGDLRSAGIELE